MALQHTHAPPAEGICQILPFNDPRAVETRPPRVIVRGDGCHVIDESGNRYLEMASGLWCAGLGFTNDRVAEAVAAQMRTLPFYHGFLGKAVRPALDLAQRLASMTPDPLNRVLFSNSGSEAVDTAIKIATYYNNARGLPAKKKIIARETAYHGSGIMSASLTGLAPCHHGFDLPVPQVLRTGSPSHYRDAHPGETETAFSQRRARELEALIEREGAGTIAAFIGEPVVGSGGIITPPEGYWDAIQDVLRRHDILFIADEVITGFHRTGRTFGCETCGIHPDIMILAKQLSAAFQPISATVISDTIGEVIADAAHAYGTFGHGFTYSGHPVAAAAALAVLDEYERLDVAGRVDRLAPVLAKCTESLADESAVGEVRSQGLLAGVELDDRYCREHLGKPAADTAQAVVSRAESMGVIFRAAAGGVIGVCPPMIIGEDTLTGAFATLRQAIRAETAS